MPIKIKKTDETKLKMKREDFWKYILFHMKRLKIIMNLQII